MTAWSGQWVADRLAVHLDRDEPDEPGEHGEPGYPGGAGLTVADLVGLAVRRNPKRAHLLVSTVLGKHVPTDPRIVYGAGRLLGILVADVIAAHGACSVAEAGRDQLSRALSGDRRAAGALVAGCAAHPGLPPDGRPIVVGYAETATGLGHSVADSLDAVYLHSTRRPVHGAVGVTAFEEEHSHATGHLLLPEDRQLFNSDRSVVLVDDELSTGRTVLNTIAALQALHPRDRYVIATLVDVRSSADRADLQLVADELGVRIDVVALATGRLSLPADVLDRGAAVAVAAECDETAPRRNDGVATIGAALTWPPGRREGGRHGFTPGDRPALERAAAETAQVLAERIGDGADVLILGCEELMYAPLRIATELADRLDGRTDVRYSTTTRSPVLPIDEVGYAIRTRLVFAAHDNPADGPGLRYAYNVRCDGRPDGRFSHIVLVVDDEANTSALREAGGLLDQLCGRAECVHVVTIPAYRPLPPPLTAPAFGSYRPADVAWLLSDLSGVQLEVPTEEREEAIQSGGAHYAESLPIEYQPDPDYQQLYQQALADSAASVAHAVGVVTELVLAERGPQAVLVSLARAGTPVGVLMRRWAQLQHGLDWPHYAISIVRGRGIDRTALRYLAAHHDPADVMFVDGWTGKGAITAELADAVEGANVAIGARFSPELAVLADTGHCVRIFGTREDYLIPSACLNSTVSGLISRTVLNDALIGPNDFHGAKFYAELAAADVSNDFVDTVRRHFCDVTSSVAQTLADRANGIIDPRPTWQGHRTVEDISQRYGIHNVNLVKPGVGETTRVLLRRVPWKVLIRRDAVARLGHIVLLAQRRGVAVELVDDLSYSCVGLIHPHFTAGATGADGVAVTASA